MFWRQINSICHKNLYSQVKWCKKLWLVLSLVSSFDWVFSVFSLVHWLDPHNARSRSSKGGGEEHWDSSWTMICLKCLEPHYLPIRKENFLSISTLWFTPSGSSGLFVEREGFICKFKWFYSTQPLCTGARTMCCYQVQGSGLLCSMKSVLAAHISCL